jgi:quercetin dioxygenase-like cupin family protein
MDSRIAIIMAFLLGACASAAATSVASEGPDSGASAEQVSAAAVAAEGAGPRLVVSADEAEHRQAPSGKADVFFLARGSNAFVARLELAEKGAVPEHRDATEEYLYILEGGGELRIDDTPYSIGPGSAIYMPANAKVSYQNGDVRLVALQVFAGPEPAAKYDGWGVVEGSPEV